MIEAKVRIINGQLEDVIESYAFKTRTGYIPSKPNKVN
jgi:hypothetical protein